MPALILIDEVSVAGHQGLSIGWGGWGGERLRLYCQTKQ